MYPDPVAGNTVAAKIGTSRNIHKLKLPAPAGRLGKTARVFNAAARRFGFLENGCGLGMAKNGDTFSPLAGFCENAEMLLLTLSF